MTPFVRGSLYWGRMDKRRPVLVISHDLRNRFASDVTIVPCSTSLRPLSWHVLLPRGEGGLPFESTAKCEQVTTLPKSDLEPRALGALGPSRMREVEQALLRALDIRTS